MYAECLPYQLAHAESYEEWCELVKEIDRQEGSLNWRSVNVFSCVYDSWVGDAGAAS